jgi:hypothetical protein
MKIGNQEYKLSFGLGALSKIEEKLEEAGKTLDNIEYLFQGKGKLKNIIWVVMLGVNNTIRRSNILENKDQKLFDEESLGVLIDVSNFKSLILEIREAMSVSNSSKLKGHEENEEKNMTGIG